MNKIKLLVAILAAIFLATMPTVYAKSTGPQVIINAQFMNIFDNNLIGHKVITIRNGLSNKVLMTHTKNNNNGTSTLAFILKYAEIRNGQVDLQFNLVQYGANQATTVITQPRIVIQQRPGQSAQISSENYTINLQVV